MKGSAWWVAGLTVGLILAVPGAAACFNLVLGISTPMVPIAEMDGRTVYTYYYRGVQGVWEESNEKTELGVQAHHGNEQGDTGLQIHDVCYGTFDTVDVTVWNWEASDGGFGDPSGEDPTHNRYNYIPFTAEAAEHYEPYQDVATFDAAGCQALDGTYVTADLQLR